jgi:hypothetical protein
MKNQIINPKYNVAPTGLDFLFVFIFYHNVASNEANKHHRCGIMVE